MRFFVSVTLLVFLLCAGSALAGDTAVESKEKIRLGEREITVVLKKMAAHRWTSTFQFRETASASKLSEYFSLHQIKVCRGEGRKQVDLERVTWEPRITEVWSEKDRFVKGLETQWTCAERGRRPADVSNQAAMEQYICAATTEPATKKLCLSLQK